MKTRSFIQWFFCALVGLAVLMTAVSCGDDDKDKDAKPDNFSGKRLVTRIESDELTWTFSYDEDGNLTRMYFYEQGYGEGTYTLSKVGSKLVVTYNEKDDNRPVSSTFSSDLNSDGYIVSAVDDTDESDFSCKFTYNDGYLKSYGETSYGEKYLINYEWKNGNLSRYTESGDYPGTGIYSFTNRENKMNIDPGELLYGIYGWGMAFVPFSAAYLGKKNKCLIEKYVYTSKDGNYIDEFTYEFDKDGYVTQFVLTDRETVNSYTDTYINVFKVYY